MSCRAPFQQRAGTTALEFAMLSLPMLSLVLGSVEIARLAWTQAALQTAVEQAARCWAVNQTVCSTNAQIQNYAESQILAYGVPASAFTAATKACGQQVSASLPYQLLVPGIFPAGAITLTASSCSPARD